MSLRHGVLIVGVTLVVLGCGSNGGVVVVMPNGGSGGGPAGGSSGSGGGTGGGAGGGTGGGGPVSCTGACGANQVCVSGVCVDVPAQCPCPRESYCDLSKSTCVIGCAQDSDCATGRVCNTTTRSCFDGCHQDAACGAGRICDDTTMSCRAGCRVKADCSGGLACIGTMCLAGCATTADCTSTGETCVSNACMCPSGQMACSGKCTATNTVANCGACGMACKANETCTNNQCTCPSGTCQPQIVYDNGGTPALGGIWVDGGYVYVSERTTPGATIRRVPVAGGTATLVATLGANSYGNIAVANGQVIFTDETIPSTGYSTEYLYLVPGAGGTPTQIDSAYHNQSITSPFGIDATYAYWWNWVQTSTVEGAISQVITLWRITVSTRARTMLATSTNLPDRGIFVQGTGLYFADDHGSSYDVQRVVGSSTSVATVNTTTATLQGMFVDSAGIYISDYGTTKRIVRMNLDGTGSVPLSTTDRSNIMASDATYLYYLPIDGTPKSIYRVAKTGATAPALFYAPPAGAGDMKVAADGYVYFTTNNQVVRLATSHTP